MKIGITALTMMILAGVVTVLMTTCVLGCGDDNNVVKGDEGTVVELAEPESTQPLQVTDPPPEPKPIINHLDKAREMYTRATERAEEIQEENPGMRFVEAEHLAFKETFGFGALFVEEKLFRTYMEEKPDAQAGGKGIYTPSLVLEYLRLSLKFPDKREDGLLRLFRESIQAGDVLADPDNPKPSLKPEAEEEEEE